MTGPDETWGSWDWLTDWFERHVNLFRVILSLEVRNSRSLHVHIYTFMLLFLKDFLNGLIENEWFLNKIYLTQR